MAGGKYAIGRKTFPTKESIANYVRWVIELTPEGELVDDINLAWLKELAKQHTYAKLKIGSGVQSFRVEVNKVWGKHKVLTLIRTDGTETDFSWRECIWHTSQRQRVTNACRAAVADQIQDFVRRSFEAGEVRCAITGQVLSPGNHHVDHSHPVFADIVSGWLLAISVDPDDIEVAGLADGEMRDRFADANLSQSFWEFHRLFAALRLVSPQANLRRSRKAVDRG